MAMVKNFCGPSPIAGGGSLQVRLLFGGRCCCEFSGSPSPFQHLVSMSQALQVHVQHSASLLAHVCTCTQQQKKKTDHTHCGAPTYSHRRAIDKIDRRSTWRISTHASLQQTTYKMTIKLLTRVLSTANFTILYHTVTSSPIACIVELSSCLNSLHSPSKTSLYHQRPLPSASPHPSRSSLEGEQQVDERTKGRRRHR